MDWITYLFGSGIVFFVGIALNVVAVGIFARGRHNWVTGLATLLATGGLVLIAASATPVPYWLYGVAGIISVVWLAVERCNNATWLPYRWRLRALVILAWLGCAAIELPYHFVPSLTGAGKPTLFIVGDSVSAGIDSNDRANAWPGILSRLHGVEVADQSQMGATARSALKQADNLRDDDQLVLLEIGGNDLLGDTSVREFERSLEALLKKVTSPKRTIIMFELPLPPFHNEFGSVQRRLAAQYGVVLVPKRVFISILSKEGNTLDGVHLSKAGHQKMADVVWSLISPAYDKAR